MRRVGEFVAHDAEGVPPPRMRESLESGRSHGTSILWDGAVTANGFDGCVSHEISNGQT